MSRLLKLCFLLVAAAGFLFGDNAYFTYQIGDPLPTPQYFTITSTTSIPVSNLAIRTSGQSWIIASLSGSSTPAILTVSVNPMGLAAGTYAGVVEVHSPNSSTATDVGVTVVVTPAPPPLTASPSSVTFNAVQGSAAPPAQSVQLGASLANGTAIFSDTPSLPSWLKVNNSTFWIGIFNSPATLQFSVDHSSLAPGSYTTTIKFYTIVPTTQVTVTITLNVVPPPPALKTSTSSLQFQYMVGGTVPAFQTVQVSSSGSALGVSVTSNAAWLSVGTAGGNTPFGTTVNVNPVGLAPGNYNGQLMFATILASQSAPSQIVNVTLTITPDNRPTITSVVNGASFTSTIAPGTWISIMGSNFATKEARDSSAWLQTTLNGASVQLSGAGGSYSLLMSYVGPTQINAFVPYEVSPMMYGATGTLVRVNTPTGSATLPVDCAAISPAFFIVNHYVAAILFPDYSIVGTAAGMKPVSSGSVVSLYGTGMGQTNPASSNINGPIAASPLATNPVVTVGGVQATILWAGMVSMGLYQINIQVPPLPAPGDYPVVVQVNGTNSPSVSLPVR